MSATYTKGWNGCRGRSGRRMAGVCGWVSCLGALFFTGIVARVQGILSRLRPYHVENTASRPISQVKQRRALLVLGSETAWESRVL